MKHLIPHDVDRALARLATRAALKGYRARFPQFSPGGSWRDDDTAEVWFQTPVGRIEGLVTIKDNGVQLHLTKLPFAARVFRRQAIKIVEDEVKVWIDKAKKGLLTD
jgi:hypothetical protein